MYKKTAEWANIRLGESVSNLYRAKITLGEFKAVYSILFVATEFQPVLVSCYFRIDAEELQASCQSALQSFNLCMFYEPEVYTEEDSRDENLQYLDDDLVFKLVIMCMASIYLLQLRGRAETVRYHCSL